MDEVILDGEQGRSLTFRRVSKRDFDSFWTYRVTLSLPEGSMATDVHDRGTRLATFFRELADAWRGFSGTKDFGECDSQFSLSCVYDGHGMVRCRVRLSDGFADGWHTEATVALGAGAHLERLAGAIEGFVEASERRCSTRLPLSSPSIARGGHMSPWTTSAIVGRAVGRRPAGPVLTNP
jgi:hypothetical protein